MIIISAVCKIYLNVSKKLFCINFRHLNLRVKGSFGTKFSFCNDFKGVNTSGHKMSSTYKWGDQLKTTKRDIRDFMILEL